MCNVRGRSALLIAGTELNDFAAPAIIVLSSMSKNGQHAPPD